MIRTVQTPLDPSRVAADLVTYWEKMIGHAWVRISYTLSVSGGLSVPCTVRMSGDLSVPCTYVCQVA